MKKEDKKPQLKKRTPKRISLMVLLIVGVFAIANLIAIAATQNWPFSNESNYTYDSNKIRVYAGTAHLKSNTSAVQVNQHDTQGEFDGGVYLNSAFDTTAVKVHPSLVSTRGVVGYWNFNEGSGPDALDTIGGRNGTYQGSPASVAGQSNFGTTLDFDSGDYIEVPDADELTFSTGSVDQPFSISAWVYLDDATNFEVMGKGAQEWGLYFDATDKLGFRIYDADQAAGYLRFTNATTFTSDEGSWIHIAATYDGSASGLGMGLYRNGVVVDDATGNIGSGYVAMENTTDNVTIGQGAITSIVDGRIDDVILFNRVLTAAEVQAIANAGREFAAPKNVQYNFDSYIASGLVSYWNMSNGIGQAVTDIIGSHNGDIGATSGVEATDPTWVNAGRIGTYSLSFDGTDDFVRIDDHADFDFTTVFSVAAWIKTGLADNAFVDKLNNPASGFRFQHQGSGALSFGVADGAFTTVTSNINTTDNSWHQVVGTYNGTNTSLKLYIDGEFAAENLSAPASIATNNLDLRIGKTTTDGGPWDGLIDDVGIWNRELSAEEVRSLFGARGDFISATMDGTATNPSWSSLEQTGSVSFGKPLEKPPVGYWKIDEGANTTITDAMGTSNGTVMLGGAGNTTIASAWDIDQPTFAFDSSHSILFDGVDDYISIADHDDFSFGNGTTDSPFSVSAWVNTEVANDLSIVSKGGGGVDNEWHFFVSSIDLRFRVCADSFDCDNAYAGRNASTVLNTNEWYHVAATYDGRGGGTAQDGIRLYINGVRADKFDDWAPGYTAMDNESGPVIIGQNPHSFNAQGKIDEVAIFDYELTPEHVAKLASAEYRPHVPVDNYEKDLLALWHFDNDAIDNSGSYHGTLNGGNFTSGVMGPAVSLDGAGDYVDFDQTLMNGQCSGAISLWFKRNAWAFPDSTILTKSDGLAWVDNHIQIARTASTDDIHMTISDNVASTSNWVTVPNIEANVWHHVTMTWDGSTLVGYHNGIQVDSYSTSICVPSDSTRFSIGRSAVGGTRWFDGMVDEVALFSTDLTAAQVKDIYSRGAARLKTQLRTGPADPPTAGFRGVGAPDTHSGLVGLWHFNQAESGSIANNVTLGFEDALGNHNGTTNNANSSGMSWSSGQIFGSVDFDGTDDYVEIADHSDFSFGNGSTDNEFSLAGWINMDVSENFEILSKFDVGATNREWHFLVNSGDSLTFHIWDESADAALGRQYLTPMSGDEGKWIHVAATYDGSAALTGIKLYRNGIRVDNWNNGSGSGYVAMENTTEPVRIGHAQQYANGRIDEVGIWERELSGTEIFNLYERGRHLTHSSTFLHGISDVRYLQYRSVFDSLDESLSSDLSSMTSYLFGGPYVTDNPSITTNTGQAFTYLTGFTETGTFPTGSAVGYHLSPDDGTTWYYHNGSNWAVTDNSYAQSNPETDVNTNISTLDNDANLTADGSIKVRALLNSDGQVRPRVSEIDVDYEIASVTMVSPNTGAENWAAGSRQFIEWSNTGVVPDGLDLEYNTTGSPTVFSSPGNIATGLGNHHNEETLYGSLAVYHFGNNTSGAIANGATTDLDDSKNSNNGTASNVNTTGMAFISGPFGGAVDFDGTDDYIDIGSSIMTALDSAAEFSVTAWFNADNATSLIPIVGHGAPFANDNSGFILVYRGDSAGDPMEVQLNNGSGSNTIIWNVVGDISGAWHHVAVTIDRDGNMVLYVDGASTSIDVSPQNGGTINLGGSFFIGKYGNTANVADAQIDEVAIFDRVLTPAEVTALADTNPGYLWKVAAEESSSMRVQVRSTDAPAIRDAADNNFTIDSHQITWEVKDSDTGTLLDSLSVSETDAEGNTTWNVTDYSLNTSSTLNQYYGDGLHTTTWTKVGYEDLTITDWNADSDKTNTVFMQNSATLTNEFRAQLNYTYEHATTTLRMSAWVERAGAIMTNAGDLGTATVVILDDTGATVTTQVDATVDANGYYDFTFDNSGADLISGNIYPTKVTIDVFGNARTTGHAINITAEAELGAVQTNLTNLQTTVGAIATTTTSIDGKVDTLTTKVDNIQSDVDGIKTATGVGQSETLYQKLTDSVSVLGQSTDNASDPTVFGRIKDVRDNLDSGTTPKGTVHVFTQRYASVKSGETLSLMFKTDTGTSPTITVYDAGEVMRVNADAMTELGSTGIFQYSLTVAAGWGLGDFTILASQGGNMDAMTVSVISTDLSTLATDLGAVQAKTDTINWTDVDNLTSSLANISIDMTNLVDDLVVERVQVTDASATTTSFTTDLNSTTDDFYNDMLLVFTSGLNDGQVRRVSDYVGGSKTLTLTPALSAAPAQNDTFTVLPQAGGGTGGGLGTADVAAIWGYSQRRLTDALLDSGSLSTFSNLSSAQSAIQSDIATVDGNVDTLVTEIGSGNISAIRTATDTIDWLDVDGLVTTAGQIKAKTDDIVWTDIAAIKTATDTIDWADVDQIALDTADMVPRVQEIQGDLNDLINDLIVARSTVVGGSATTISFTSGLTNATDDFYNDQIIVFTGGQNAGQVRRIDDYDGASKLVTLSSALSFAPADTDSFTILSQAGGGVGGGIGSGDVTAITNAIWTYTQRRLTDGVMDAESLATISDLTSAKDEINNKLDDLLSELVIEEAEVNDGSPSAISFITTLTNANDDFYNDLLMLFKEGPNAGQIRRVDDYIGASKTVVLNQPLLNPPNDTDDFKILAQAGGSTGGGDLTPTAIATAIWAFNSRSLDTANLDVGSIATLTDLTNTETNLESDISDVDGKIDTVVNEVGTGDILAIKTVTDTINWANVNALSNTVTNIQTDLGKLVNDLIIARGQVVGTPADNLTFVTDLSATQTDLYANQLLVFRTGNNAGQVRMIESYNGGTKAVTLSTGLSNIPANTNEFTILSIAGGTAAGGGVSPTDVALAVWGYTAGGGRTLTGAGLDTGSLATLANINSAQTAIQTDVGVVDTNVDTLVSQIGSGKIDAILTDTGAIDWSDIDGLVTTTGVIQAKTDTIDWGDVGGVRTSTDLIEWNDVTGIKLKTDDIVWTDVTDILADTGNMQPRIQQIEQNLQGIIDTLTVEMTTINDVAPSTTAFETNLVQTVDDFYKDHLIVFTTGVNKGQVRRIATYTAANKLVTLVTSLSNTPLNGDAFTVLANVGEDVAAGGVDPVAISTAVWNYATRELSTAALDHLDGGSLATLDALTNLENVIKRKVGGRILSKDLKVVPGQTVGIRIQHETGAVPQLNIYDPSNNVVMAGATMSAIGSSGVYLYNWKVDTDAELGEYMAVISDDNNEALDSVMINVVASITDPSKAPSSSGGEFSRLAYSESKKVFEELLLLKQTLGTGSTVGEKSLANKLSDVESGLAKLKHVLPPLVDGVEGEGEAGEGAITMQKVHGAVLDVMNEIRTVSSQQGVNLDKVYNTIAMQGESQREIQNMMSATEAAVRTTQEIVEKARDKPVMTTWFEA